MLKNLNIYKNKHVPINYKINSRAIRLSVLAGLIDTDGHYDSKRHCYEIAQKLKSVADDILFLALSLGYIAYANYRQKYCMYKGKRRYGWYYIMHLHGTNMAEVPCLLSRKKSLPHTHRTDLLVGINIHAYGYGRYYGFQTDGNHLVVLNNFTVI